MKSMILALGLALTMPAAYAQAGEITGPTEVGTTTMPAGQYYVTEQISHKTFDLTVTQKGNMILAPAPPGVQVTLAPSAVPAAPAAAAVAAPAAAATAAPAAAAVAAPAAGAAPAAAATAAGSPVNLATGAMKGLVKQGMQKGMNELMKQGGEGALKNLLK